MYFPEWILIIMDIRRLKGDEETEGKKLEGKAKNEKKKGFSYTIPQISSNFYSTAFSFTQIWGKSY